MAFSFAFTGPCYLQRGEIFSLKMRPKPVPIKENLPLGNARGHYRPSPASVEKPPARAASRQPLSQQGHAGTFIPPENMIGLRQGTARKTSCSGPQKNGNQQHD
jgi:hypothetical protein